MSVFSIAQADIRAKHIGKLCYEISNRVISKQKNTN
jgi:hypothetical protein